MSNYLRDAHFSKLANLIEGHTGIQLPPTKRAMIEGRLQRRARALNFDNVRAYGDALFTHGLLGDEFDHLVDCTTTNKTDFFREPDHFDVLAQDAVPRLLSERKQSLPLKIWSAACSNGAEAYTIAMVLAATGNLRFSVLGTDICRTVLGQARAAIYPSSMAEDIPKAFRDRFVMSARSPARKEVRIVPELRACCRFDQLNLMDERFTVDHDVDVIFCRNVLIYFDLAKQNEVISKLITHLRPGGYLILGHTETFALQSAGAVQQIMPSVFRRIAGATSARKAA